MATKVFVVIEDVKRLPATIVTQLRNQLKVGGVWGAIIPFDPKDIGTHVVEKLKEGGLKTPKAYETFPIEGFYRDSKREIQPWKNYERVALHPNQTRVKEGGDLYSYGRRDKSDREYFEVSESYLFLDVTAAIHDTGHKINDILGIRGPCVLTKTDVGFYDRREKLIARCSNYKPESECDKPTEAGMTAEERAFFKTVSFGSRYGSNDPIKHPTFSSDGTATARIKSAEENISNIPKEDTMKNPNGERNVKAVFEKAVDTNRSAAVLAAKLEVGEAVLNKIVKVIKPQAPVFLRGYLDTPLGKVLLANLVGNSLRYAAPNNDKAELVAEALITTSVVAGAKELNIGKVLSELLDGVDLSSLEGSKD